jgi:hypothetical protein
MINIPDTTAKAASDKGGSLRLNDQRAELIVEKLWMLGVISSSW